MIAAVMQPYFFPYIGYFQLMEAVDTFVIFDDVQYIQRGWVNRNLIVQRDMPTWLTLPVIGASRSLSINERHYDLDDGRTVRKIVARLHANYRKAPFVDEALAVIAPILDFPDSNVAAFNANLLRAIAASLGIACQFRQSSEFSNAGNHRAQDRIINICNELGADRYINPIGGVQLYAPAAFEASGIELCFLRTTAPATSLCEGLQHLSIIHMLMNEGIVGVRSHLEQFEVLDPAHAVKQ